LKAAKAALIGNPSDAIWRRPNCERTMPTTNFDLAALPGAAANHFLAREQWARERMAAHAGRTFVLAAAPLAATFTIAADGAVDSTFGARDEADATLRVPPMSVPALLAEPSRWDEFVAAEGDPALITTLKELAITLPWFVEKAFASVLGPIVGQRVADAGRHLLQFPGYAGNRIGASVAAYTRDEAALAASRAQGEAFAADVAAIAARADALAERLDALAARATPARPRTSSKKKS
jgi:ubiquinone biosynthesis protein UbiJ